MFIWKEVTRRRTCMDERRATDSSVSLFDCFCHQRPAGQTSIVNPPSGLSPGSGGGGWGGGGCCCCLSLFGIDKKRLVSGECVVTVIKGRPCPHYYFSHCGRRSGAFGSTLICSPAGRRGLGLAPPSPRQTAVVNIRWGRYDQYSEQSPTGGRSPKVA